jgi:hypothetical protein
MERDLAGKPVGHELRRTRPKPEVAIAIQIATMCSHCSFYEARGTYLVYYVRDECEEKRQKESHERQHSPAEKAPSRVNQLTFKHLQGSILKPYASGLRFGVSHNGRGDAGAKRGRGVI